MSIKPAFHDLSVPDIDFTCQSLRSAAFRRDSTSGASGTADTALSASVLLYPSAVSASTASLRMSSHSPETFCADSWDAPVSFDSNASIRENLSFSSRMIFWAVHVTFNTKSQQSRSACICKAKIKPLNLYTLKASCSLL